MRFSSDRLADVADPDPHYFWMLDPDTHWSEKLDPDPR
jgi:hypothetical protein